MKKYGIVILMLILAPIISGCIGNKESELSELKTPDGITLQLKQLKGQGIYTGTIAGTIINPTTESILIEPGVFIKYIDKNSLDNKEEYIYKTFTDTMRMNSEVVVDARQTKNLDAHATFPTNGELKEMKGSIIIIKSGKGIKFYPECFNNDPRGYCSTHTSQKWNWKDMK